jgi:hypothetical protein
LPAFYDESGNFFKSFFLIQGVDMKQKLTWRAFTLLAAAVFLFVLGACEQVTGPEPGPEPDKNVPEKGIMTKITAAKVFEFDETEESVTILKFLDVGALGKYIDGSDDGTGRQAGESKEPDPLTVRVNRINNKPVIRIAEKAFTPVKSDGSDDISTLPRVLYPEAEAPAALVIVLPESLEVGSLKEDKDLFAGVSAPVTVEIPPPVIEKIKEKIQEEAAAAGGDALTPAEVEAKLAEELGEVIGAGSGAITVQPEAPAGTEPAAPIVVVPPAEPAPPPTPAPPAPSYPAPPYTPPPPSVVSIREITLEGPANDGDGVPNSRITGTAQYSGEVTWSPALDADGKFVPGTAYTATITLTVNGNYTLDGVGENFFTVAGAAATNAAGSEVITALFSGYRTVQVSEFTIGGVSGPDATAAPANAIASNAQFTGTVTWDNNHAANSPFAAGKLYTATIALTPKRGYLLSSATQIKVTGADTVTTDNITEPDSATVTAKFSTIRADDGDSLKTAIGEAKDYTGSTEPVIYLSEAFYTDVNNTGTAITIDGGDVANDEGKSYTIQGLGKDSTHALTVGVVLANDHITLKGVNISVNGVTKAAPAGGLNYKAALVIWRMGSNGNVISGQDANNHVTVQDCTISYYTTAADMAAGIFIAGTPTDVPDDINITGNTITVTNTNKAATQGILVRTYGSGVKITKNEIGSTNNDAAGGTDTPASALFLQIHPDYATDADAVTGNTLSGGHFDFYITILGKDNRAGASPGLFGDKFGTAETKWATEDATDSNSYYKNLLTALVKQVENGQGFGRFAMLLGASTTWTDRAQEYYKIDGKEITEINYWSPGIEGNAYKNTIIGAENSDTLQKTSAPYGRREKEDNGGNSSWKTTEKEFHWLRQ